jgi:hypothetical protein
MMSMAERKGSMFFAEAGETPASGDFDRAGYAGVMSNPEKEPVLSGA